MILYDIISILYIKKVFHSQKETDSKSRLLQCWNCNQVLKVLLDWQLAQCLYCNKINKVNQYENQKGREVYFKNDDQIQLHLYKTKPLPIKIMTSHRPQFNNNQYTYNLIESSFCNSNSNHNQNIYLKGPCFPYLPPDYQWHEQMEEYIGRLNKINKLYRKIRKDYNEKFTIHDEITRPRVYAIKTLIDSVDDIGFRRENLYRDLLRGDYNLKDNTYKDLLNSKKVYDFDIIKGDYIGKNKNIYKFKESLRNSMNNKGNINDVRMNDANINNPYHKFREERSKYI